jgi:cytochrome c oxidase subunit 2
MEKLKHDWMSMPVLGSRHGADVDMFVVYVHYLMAFLFVIWFAYFCYALWRFSAKRSPKADAVGVRNHLSTWLELAVAAIEVVLLVGFAIPLWAKQVDQFPKDSDATVIRVVAEQFSWNSRYTGPDGKFGKQDMLLAISDNPLGYDSEDPASKDDVTPPLKDLRAPFVELDADGDGKPDLHPDGSKKHKPVVIHLSSKDVIHSFKVNTLRVCQDAIPGMSIPIHFEPIREGRYLITCAQLCGNGHASMNGWFTVESADSFAAWQEMNKPVAGVPAGASFE